MVRVRCYLDLPSLGEIAVKRGLSRSLYKNWKPKLLFKYSISTSSACDVLFYLHEKKKEYKKIKNIFIFLLLNSTN